MRAPAEERFWAKVEKTEACWNWIATKTADGYGRFLQKSYTLVLSHRYSYEMTNGPVPAGMVIDHTCHNASCVNPEHLRAVTHKQNMENSRGARVNNTSGVPGVHWDKKANKWYALVSHNRKRHYVGGFDTLPEAEAAVIAKRNELFTHNDLDRIAS